uniref:Ras-GEF domain-containing protein n=1 Tax=Myotis lucifugus TaxID=59463 RepID=G1NZD6_MYOLU
LCLCRAPTRDITEGLVNGFNYSTFLGPGKVHRATDTIQGWTQCAAEFTLRLCEARRLRALQKGTLEKVAASLVPAFPAGNIPHICTLMPIHPAFSRAQWFLDELLTSSYHSSDAIKVFSTSGGTPPHNDRGDTPQEQLAKATASVMGTWPDRVQYLGQPLIAPWFTLKEALVLHSRPAPHPVGLVRSLWVELAHLEPTEAQWEGEGTAVGEDDWGSGAGVQGVSGARIPLKAVTSFLSVEMHRKEPAPEPPPELKLTPEPEEGPAPGLEPGPAVVVLEPSGPPALIRIPTTERAPPQTTDYPRAGTPKHLTREEKLNILTFPPRLVAEQLTAMDVELFKKVLPHQCLGSIWSQRRKPGKEHVASTVRATVRQFNYVATCVITTCLGDPSMMAWDRAKVVEHWIKVAKECRLLRNFSSLHAILAALQSVAVHRLKKTWGQVSSLSLEDSLKMFTFLVPITRRRNDTESSGEPMSLEEVSHFPEEGTGQGARPRPKEEFLESECVPFLGEYLKELKAMDTLMEDDLEVESDQLAKKEKVQRVLEEIVVLQEAAQKYQIEPEEQFRTWFWALKRLSENESYIWSCQLEPQS